MARLGRLAANVVRTAVAPSRRAGTRTRPDADVFRMLHFRDDVRNVFVGGTQVGTNRNEPILDGRVAMERWRLVRRSEAGACSR